MFVFKTITQFYMFSRYLPIQGDADGRMYCVDEDGEKIPGSDFFGGNKDCTKGM